MVVDAESPCDDSPVALLIVGVSPTSGHGIWIRSAIAAGALLIVGIVASMGCVL